MTGPTANERRLALPTLAFVGLDVSLDDASVCFLLADRTEPVPGWTIPNTQAGAEELSARVARLAQTEPVDQLRIGREATGLLCWHLAGALKDAAALASFAPRISALNPHLITTFRAN